MALLSGLMRIWLLLGVLACLVLAVVAFVEGSVGGGLVLLAAVVIGLAALRFFDARLRRP